MRNTDRDLVGGILLIAGSLAGMVVMVLHPTAHHLIAGEGGEPQAHLNVMVHGLAIASMPVLFMGLLGLARRLGFTDLTLAALVAFGFGAVAVMSAAVASGFVATPLVPKLLAAEGGSRDIYHALLDYTGLINQGFARVYVVAASAAILLWSAGILRGRRMPRAVGIVGALLGTAILIAVISGHLRLDVHGFGAVTFAQSGWMIWIGVLLCREGPKDRD